MLEKIGDIVLTDEYWDCNCEEDYIKPASMKHCEKCGADWDEGPSSRLDEVLAMKLPVEDMKCPENEPQKMQRQFTKATLPILEAFEQRLFEFHQDADLTGIIPHSFRQEWASAMDRLQMILMAARTLCREERSQYDFYTSTKEETTCPTT